MASRISTLSYENRWDTADHPYQSRTISTLSYSLYRRALVQGVHTNGHEE